MMNIKLALIISVSAYALQMNPVYASLLSSPPASILDTNIHTSITDGRGKFAAEGLCPEARCSEILLSQAHCRSQTCHNIQSSARASFSTVIPNQILSSSGLTRGSRSNKDSLATWMTVQRGCPRMTIRLRCFDTKLKLRLSMTILF